MIMAAGFNFRLNEQSSTKKLEVDGEKNATRSLFILVGYATSQLLLFYHLFLLLSN